MTGNKKDCILIPFGIDIEPMSRLLLVNFEKDPDSTYIGFEPQVFDDAVHGKGHLIIGWRKDGKVDVYHQPSLKLDPKGYDIVGKGLASMEECEMQEASFEIGDNGVRAQYIFNDLQNRQVQIKITERHPKKTKPFGLLAPMGDAAEHPSAMPMVLLHDFYFVRRKHTVIEVSINGVKHALDLLPLPMDLTKMYFARYSPKPLIARFNPAFSGPVNFLETERGATKIRKGEYEYDLIWKKDKAHISKIIRKNDVHPIHLSFDGPFPNIHNLVGKISQSGKFMIEAHPSVGRIAGDYTVEGGDDNVNITLLPSRGWIPKPTKFSLWFLYTMVGIFKKWPSTYLWTANINRQKNSVYRMSSYWKRI